MSDEKAIERASSYRQMMSNWAWKDLESVFDTIRQDALESGINSESMEKVYIQKGIVKCVDRIKSEISAILENR